MLNSNLQKIWHSAMMLTNNTVPIHDPSDYLIHERVLRENFAKMLCDARLELPDDPHLFNDAFIEEFINKALGYILSSST